MQSNINTAKENNKNRKNKVNEVTSKVRRKPNPWAGESMFRAPPNTKITSYPRVTFKNPFNKKPRNKVTVTPVEMAKNFVNTIKNLKRITNTNQPMNVREQKVKNTVNRVVKEYRAYMNSEGPSSGAPKLFLKEAMTRTPDELKVLAAAIIASAGYGAYTFTQRYKKFILPTILTLLLKKNTR